MTRAPVGDEAASSVVRSGQPCAVGSKRTRGPTVNEDCASLHERANGGSNATCTNGIKTPVVRCYSRRLPLPHLTYACLLFSI